VQENFKVSVLNDGCRKWSCKKSKDDCLKHYEDITDVEYEWYNIRNIYCGKQ
jgi:hypothetical protein